MSEPVPTAGNTPDIGSELHQVILILSGPVCGRTVAKAIKRLGTIKESIRDAERVAASSKEATPSSTKLPSCTVCGTPMELAPAYFRCYSCGSTPELTDAPSPAREETENK